MSLEVENTGGHNQFYEKFNMRYHISQILKKLWADGAFKVKVIEESQYVFFLYRVIWIRDTEFFVKFVNLLMNDTTYLLDESLKKLAEIKNIQIEVATPEYLRSTAVYLIHTLLIA